MIGSEYPIGNETYNSREELKRFYLSSPLGVQELCDIIRLGGLLSKITDEREIVAHNFAVERLERIGLLDEEGLEDLVIWMLKRPATKRPVEA